MVPRSGLTVNVASPRSNPFSEAPKTGSQKASKLAAFRDKDKQPKQLQRGKKGGMFYMTEGGQKVYTGRK